MKLKPEINDEKTKQKIAEYHKRFLAKSKSVIEEHSLLLIGHLRNKYMTGGTTTDTRIRRRSGQLADSMMPIMPAKVKEKSLSRL